MDKKLSKNGVKGYEKLILNDNLLFEINAIPQMVVNGERVIVRVNKKFIKLFGYSSNEVLGQQTSLLTPSMEKYEEYRKHFIQTKEGIIKSEELEYRKKDGTLFWVKLEGNPILKNAKEILILWSFIDITKEVNYRKALEKMASTDPLTSLYNRRYFRELASTVLKFAMHNKLICSIIMIDIDKFKRINDAYGHQAGDEVIKDTANILKNNLREGDILSRWGGEEFVIILPRTELAEALNIAEKLRRIIELHSVDIFGMKNIHFTVSLGVSAGKTDESLDLDSLLNKADKALYTAKEKGRNRVGVC